MIPKLIGLEIINNWCIWFTNQSTFGVSFFIKSIDLEVDNIQLLEQALAGFLRNLPEDCLLRIKTEVFDEPFISGEFSRKTDLIRLTQTQRRISLHFESHTSSLVDHIKALFRSQVNLQEDLARNFVNQIRLDFLTPLEPIPWTEDDVKEYFKKISARAVIYSDFGLTLGTEYLGIVKLTDLAKYQLETPTLGLILQSLDTPFELTLTLSKIDPLKMNFILNQKSTQEKTGSGLVSDEKYRESEESIRDLELGGNQYFHLESHLLLKDNDQKSLLRRIDQAENALTSVGEYQHEVIGAFHSFAATLIGAKTHFGQAERLIEKDSNISCYCPLFFQGFKESRVHQERTPKKLDPCALAYHRNDGSIDFFNIYDENNSSYSAFVIGQPGKGKSVFVNQVVRALLYNEKTSIVVLDVKGSYRRQCEFLNGKLFEVDWNKSAFINPLSFLTNEKVLGDANSIEIVYQFLQSLVLDKDESELSGREEIELKQFIKTYLAKKPITPSIDDFAHHAKGFRTDHLSRWTKEGIYEHVFANSFNITSKTLGRFEGNVFETRFKYFNIQDIAQASNKTLSSVLMSAIMAEVLMHFLIKKVDDPFVFVIDEAPFFVRHCFESFRFLVKNVRKMNGSLFIVVQKSTDLIVNGNTDLISDIPNKIIFTSDGGRTWFQSLMDFTEEEMETISELETENRKYAKFFLKDHYGSRVGSIVLTPEEYWRSTTMPSDLALIEKVREVFPNASYEQIQKTIIELEPSL